MSKSVSNVEEYRLIIEGELLDLVRQATALAREVRSQEEYNRRTMKLQNRLYDLYQEIGWSVVYDLKSVPF